MSLHERIRAALEAEANDLKAAVIEGGVSGWDEYKGLVGKIDGLRRAWDIVTEQFQSSDEEDV